MKECEECGKTLKMLEGYKHPTMGKKHFLCSPCFEQVDASLALWRDFVLANSFRNGSSGENTKLSWKDILPSRRTIVENVSAETSILIRK
jgi:hypothetical protein